MYISAASDIGDNVAYTIGIVNGNSVTYVGWCKQTNGYEDYEDDFLETFGGNFIGYVPVDYFGSEEMADVVIPKCDTPEQAEQEIAKAQPYYSNNLFVIRMIQDADESWVPGI